ncbi:glycosyltransferase family 4 protein [Desulfovibrio subterraneus]|uniref:glycosyltransferase family 4 protein n=1 Tax=Desulfovibrio subterraneus TaxID=2718620 RepID=UPI00157AAC71|nr:glycosyltransferase family 4 protein [Desulfovibrio subterraneus]
MKLVLFFTRGMSLRQWVAQGLFDREKLLYEGLLASGRCSRIWWVTYGSNDAEVYNELVAQGRILENIAVLSMPRVFESKLGKWVWSVLAPFFFSAVIRLADVVKTNQMDGAWSAAIASWLHHKPLYVRTGYTWSLFERGTGWKSAVRRGFARLCERLMYRASTVAAVSSKADLAILQARHAGLGDRIFLLPNYIDTNLFNPASAVEREERVLFVGRLTAQKNLEVLIRAAHQVGLPLDLVGQGEEEANLRRVVSGLQADVRYLGRVSNSDLPDVMRKYRYFALVSHYEGMPKALLEAMACGCLCVGTDVEGIREVVTDGVTGILAPSVGLDSVRDALVRAVGVRDGLLGEAASQYVVSCFSFQNILEMEAQILRRAKAGV